MSNCSASERRLGRRKKGDRRVALFFSAPAPQPGGARLRGLLGILSLLLLAGCAAGPPPDEPAKAAGWRGPVVVFSFNVMRADHLGAFGSPLGITPELDRFAAEDADFVGRGIAASSNPLVALASSFTGTGALQHRLLGHLSANLRPGLPTLADVFWQQGYDTVFFEPQPTWLWRYGLMRGMARTEGFAEAQVAYELPLFDQLPRFYWIQLPEADTPYADRRAETPQLALPAPARAALGAEELIAYSDPARPLPAALQRDAEALFRIETAAGDARFGRLLAALRRSSAWEETLVVVTATTGTELGEHGGALNSQNLHRESIEVPLLIRLPVSLEARGFRFAEKAGTPVAAERLFATLVESLGLEAPPIVSPSLYRQARRPAISALPMGNGVSLYSAVFPAARPGQLAEQLIRRSRFAPAEPDYFAAQAVEAGTPGAFLAEDPRALFERLHQRLAHATPWDSPDVEIAAFTFLDPAGTAPLAPDERLGPLADAFAMALLHHLDAERTTEQEDQLIAAREMASPEGQAESTDGKSESALPGAG